MTAINQLQTFHRSSHFSLQFGERNGGGQDCRAWSETQAPSITRMRARPLRQLGERLALSGLGSSTDG
jgi:hypothetical protein